MLKSYIEEEISGKHSKNVAVSGKSDNNKSMRSEKAKGSKPIVMQGKTRQSALPKKSTGQKNGFKKKYTESHASCMVTFRLPKAAAGLTEQVTIVGDFNNWNEEASPMKRLRNGDFQITLELPAETEFRFRYLIQGSYWENDWCADKYMPNPFGCDDSVVIT
jgi:hypothetical protein